MNTTTTTETVTIAGRTFQVERTENHIFLHGARGAVYVLRGFLPNTGRYAVISWKSGAELRNKCGEAVRVVVLGGIIEDSAARPVRF